MIILGELSLANGMEIHWQSIIVASIITRMMVMFIIEEEQEDIRG